MATIPNPHDSVRLRILSIELQPKAQSTKMKRDIARAELRIQGKVIEELPEIKKGRPLKWERMMICDGSPNDRVDLAVYTAHRLIPGEKKPEYSGSFLISEITEPSRITPTINIDGEGYTVVIRAFDEAQVDNLFAQGQQKLKQIERSSGVIDRLGAAGPIFKSMLEFGSAVSEVNPFAKMAFAVCTYAWKRLEEQQKCGEELERLVERLAGIAPLVEEVIKQEQLKHMRQTVARFLTLIEDISAYAIGCKVKGSVIRALESFAPVSEKDRVEKFGSNFEKIRVEFRTAIDVATLQILTTVIDTHERELLKYLNPVEPSGHDPSRACQEGTRLSVLSDIDSWIHSTELKPPVMWMHGQAGVGKSTISASVCSRLAEKGTPAVSFFCKRDDPALRDPLRLISSVIYGLAWRYPAYGKLVAEAIAANPELCTSHLGVRYEGLIKKPFIELKVLQPPSPCIILADALDECGDKGTREQILSYLLDLSSLVPWLKVIVTSRPDSDICSFFDSHPKTVVSRCALQNYSAKSDIEAYIQLCLNKVAAEVELPLDSINQLYLKAGELFIWAATACRLIVDALNPQDQLAQLLGESSSGYVLDDLDLLYKAVIRNGMADQGKNNVEYMRQCIGAILVTSMRQPVSEEVLCQLLKDLVNPVVVRRVIKGLGAVLYTDETRNGVVRVYHHSFADFLLDGPRSGEFWVDHVQRNLELLASCLSVMERELRFNICELETSHLLNTEVSDLGSKIESKLTRQLAYSCSYWISHLIDGKDKKLIAGLVASVINGPHLLYWLEVLSLLQKVDVAVNGLRELTIWLEDTDISRSVWDAYRFVLAFFDPIAASAPHIYVSALAFAPKQSEIYRRLSPLFLNTIKVTKGAEERWPTWLRSISHPDYIGSMCLSRDSRTLVTGCRDGWVRIYDLRTGMLTRTIHVNSTDLTVQKVAISHNGSFVAGGTGKNVQIWNINTGDTVESIPLEETHGGPIWLRALLFSENGFVLRIIYVSEKNNSGGDITWDMDSGGILKNDPLPRSSLDMYEGVVFSPKMDWLAVGNSHGIELRSEIGGSSIVSINTKYRPRPATIALSPDGSVVAANIYDTFYGHALGLWDSRTGAKICAEVFELTDEIISIAFSQDGKRVATGSVDQTVKVWDAKKGYRIGNPLLGHSKPVTLVEFSCDGAYLVSSARDNTILIWDASASGLVLNAPLANFATLRHEFSQNPHVSAPSGRVRSVGLSPDGTRIVSGSIGKWPGQDFNLTQLQVWDALTGASIKEVQYYDDTLPPNLSYSSNGNYVLGKGQKRACIWDTRTGRRKDFKIRPPTNEYAFSPDGAYIAIHSTANDHHPDRLSRPGRIVMLDTRTGDQVGQFDASLPDVKFIAFSPDGSRLYSYHLQQGTDVTTKEKICIWNTHTYDEVKSANWILGDNKYKIFYALSPDGGSLVKGDRKRLAVLDADTGNIIAGPFRGHAGHHIRSVAFSPDGALLASSSYDLIVRLWDLRSGSNTPIAMIGKGHLHESLAFSLNGTRLVSRSGERTIHVWDVIPNTVKPWDSESTASWPTSTYNFPPHPAYPDWVSHDNKALTLWLPSHYRRTYDKHLLICMFAQPAHLPVHIDFSKFKHGADWASVKNEGALRSHDSSKQG